MSPPGMAGPTVFTLALGNGAGTTSGSIDPSPQTFAITAAQVADLKSGKLYVEVATSLFPAGEIRGQFVAVPEPGSLTLIGMAMSLGVAAGGRACRSRKVETGGDPPKPRGAGLGERPDIGDLDQQILAMIVVTVDP